MNPLFTRLAGSVADVWKWLWGDGQGEDLLPLLRPVMPFDAPPLLGSVATLGVLLALVATSGVAMTALGVLLLALLVLHFLVSEVLGISIELRPV